MALTDAIDKAVGAVLLNEPRLAAAFDRGDARPPVAISVVAATIRAHLAQVSCCKIANIIENAVVYNGISSRVHRTITSLTRVILRA